MSDHSHHAAPGYCQCICTPLQTDAVAVTLSNTDKWKDSTVTRKVPTNQLQYMLAVVSYDYKG